MLGLGLLMPVPKRVAGGAVIAKSYTYRGSGTGSSGNSFETFAIDVGTASADRLIIVATEVGNTSAITSVVVNGVTLTPDVVASNTYTAGMHSGLVTLGSGVQNVVVTWASAGFQVKTAFVWAATGLASNLKKQTTSGVGVNGTISVTAGDFLFSTARNVAGFPDFSASTETPDGTRQADIHSASADWQVNATNAAFAVNASAGSTQMVAASYA